ncbi:class I SAM-dependent methyltransferase [Azospirillum isscasi]|uniref:Class I SAM-dependent methyltransferase n=1 Tax=Azospirillum isscasi TaxID=3053926 RepID=A0ABU0WKV3_9PROT|nr:class I SAM-dependent methyltransferase [Azospirillum isscasi]MDQ2104864.1 class I SAM-dependent methyltransferase [Azospirillum isscasi]
MPMKISAQEGSSVSAECRNTADKFVCAICLGTDFNFIEKLSIGWWITDDKELARAKRSTSIGNCLTCGHVQAVGPFTPESVSNLYAPSDEKPTELSDLLSNRAPSPYANLFDFCYPDLDLRKVTKAADFGCGSGWLLAALHDKYGIPCHRLYGIDFQPSAPKDFMTIHTDINSASLSGRSIEGLPTDLDFASSYMTLEHVIDPRAVLRLIGRHLKADGYLYVMVPDAESAGNPARSGDVPLVHAHHLHYFTKSSLAALAVTSGYQVVRTESIENETCPGLVALLRKGGGFGAAPAVSLCLRSTEARYEKAASVIEKALDGGGILRLWGAGNDLTILLNRSNALQQAMVSKVSVRLYDSSLHGHTFCGRPIDNSEVIAKIKGDDWRIILTPMQECIRNSMKAFAETHGFHEKVIDPYL